MGACGGCGREVVLRLWASCRCGLLAALAFGLLSRKEEASKTRFERIEVPAVERKAPSLPRPRETRPFPFWDLKVYPSEKPSRNVVIGGKLWISWCELRSSDSHPACCVLDLAVHNISERTLLFVELRADFFDEDGVLLGSDSWEFKILPPREYRRCLLFCVSKACERVAYATITADWFGRRLERRVAWR